MKRLVECDGSAWVWEDNSLKIHETLGDWSSEYRDTIAVKVDDHGNGVVLELGRKKIRLDYDEAVEVLISLHLLAKDSNLCGDIKIRPYDRVEVLKFNDSEGGEE